MVIYPMLPARYSLYSLGTLPMRPARHGQRVTVDDETVLFFTKALPC
ncbi:MAG: hypothetical protein ACR2JR_13810 [Rubrobacteraceae bacterium]